MTATDLNKVTFYERWFNWRSQIGGSLSSWENAILEAYRIAGATNRAKLDTAFPMYFVHKYYDDKP